MSFMKMKPSSTTKFSSSNKTSRNTSSQQAAGSKTSGNFCNYSHRPCMQDRIENYEFCIRHILEDKKCPFKQCSFTSGKSAKRCPNAVPRVERKDGYCPEHARKMNLMRRKANKKTAPKHTAETLLEDLEHYIKPMPETSLRGAGDASSKQFSRKHRIGLEASRILDTLTSSEESDTEAMLVEQAWKGEQDSDAESIDSENEDLLKHAGVYTAEEVALITRDKLIRLQSLYIDQFKRLQHVLREKRRKYKATADLELETLGPIQTSDDDPVMNAKLAKYMAIKRYHRRYGKEALLHQQMKERRMAQTEGINYQPPQYQLCIHSVNDDQCDAKAIPLSKYCLKHILQDPQQVLYQPCTYGNGACGKSIAAVTDNPRCDLHTPLVAMEKRLQSQQTAEQDSLEDQIVDPMDDQALPPLARELEQDSTDYINLGSSQISMDLGLSSLLK
ncbi:KAT8 regulatory NSL complex subunit 2-like [Tubulanus polymorphus]|uniref:KAT8 regulatory NSL complex subunit 2-like n=1 Tax=Tubulanus polymorphus TaxID=672921 RepID=UPI003DA27D0F